MSLCNLSLTFQTKDIATQFKDIFEECQRRLVAGAGKTASP